MLLATLLLLSRMIAPSMAMLAADQVETLAFQTICHAEAPAQPASPSQSDHADCLLCPACHLVSQAALPTPVAAIVPPPKMVVVGVSAPVPPATGSPRRLRTSAQPTGPPALSA